MRLKDKVAIITGAGSGIGRAAALLFTREGAKVVVATKTAPKGEETVRLITRDGGQSFFVKTDVSKAAEVQAMVKAALDKYGKIDILYSNAGIEGPMVRTIDISEEDWDKVIDTNLKGLFLCCKYVIPQMIKQGGGVIISTASTLAFASDPKLSAYGASKSGVVSLVRSIALEHAQNNIRINCICPGFTDTPLLDRVAKAVNGSEEVFAKHIPLGRSAKPEEVAYSALFLATEESALITGTHIIVDGGRSAGQH